MDNYPIITSIRAADGSKATIEYYDKLPSTLELAKKYAGEGYSDRYVIVAAEQADSKITGTKLKDGEYERGIFISCILRPSMFASQAGLIGHLGAVGFLSALDEHTSKQLGLGWISDIYCEGKRIGACSTFGKLEGNSSYEYLIVSFAARLDKESFPPRLTDMLKKVFEENAVSVEMLIAKDVLNKFLPAYSSIRSPGKYMDIYSRRFILREKEIKFVMGEKKKSCKVLDVDKETGALIIEYRGEKRILNSPRSVIVPKKIKI